MKQILRALLRTWVTGALVLLAGLGYVAYTLLWIVRFMQTRRPLAIVLCITLLVALVAYAAALFLPLRARGEAVEMIIPAGTSLRTIATSLKENGIVGSSLGLIAWVKASKTERRIQAGKFIFYRNEGIFRASRRLLKAEPVDVAVTIHEGLIIEQIASVLAAAVKLDSAAFVGLCYDEKIAAQFGIEGISIEGYLFPDTYRFPENPSPTEVIRTMLRQFENKYRTLVADSTIGATYTKHQIVTMASIVEKEATVAEERSRIAGVFYNRLRLGYPLGADPTVRYILRKFSGPLKVSELNTASPYNTRVYPGLPPGPICSPGLAALQASVSPMVTRDLYFVARWDGSGAHDFSETNEEHVRKKLAARARNEEALRKSRRQQKQEQ